MREVSNSPDLSIVGKEALWDRFVTVEPRGGIKAATDGVGGARFWRRNLLKLLPVDVPFRFAVRNFVYPMIAHRQPTTGYVVCTAEMQSRAVRPDRAAREGDIQ